MGLNLSESEINNLGYNVINNVKYLGFGIGLKNFRGKLILTGNPG